MAIEIEPGYRIPPLVRARPPEGRLRPTVWVIKLLDDRGEIGWAQLSLRLSTSSYLGIEVGPAFVLDYMTIVNEFSGSVLSLLDLFRAVLEFVHYYVLYTGETLLGLLIEPANEKVERLFGEGGHIPLPRMGEPPIFFRMTLLAIQTVVQRLEDEEGSGREDEPRTGDI